MNSSAITFITVLSITVCTFSHAQTNGCVAPPQTVCDSTPVTSTGSGITCSDKDGNRTKECNESLNKAVYEECYMNLATKCVNKYPNGSGLLVGCRGYSPNGDCQTKKGSYIPPFPLWCPGQTYFQQDVNCWGYCCRAAASNKNSTY